MLQKFAMLALTLALLTASACALWRDDRIFLPPHRYDQAKMLYDQVGSIALVKEILDDAGWRRGEINEFEYRITKEIELLETESPT